MTGTSRSAAASHMPPITPPATSLSERNALADSYATWASHASSTTCSSSFLPRTPPLALISSTASRAPSVRSLARTPSSPSCSTGASTPNAIVPFSSGVSAFFLPPQPPTASPPAPRRDGAFPYHDPLLLTALHKETRGPPLTERPARNVSRLRVVVDRVNVSVLLYAARSQRVRGTHVLLERQANAHRCSSGPSRSAAAVGAAEPPTLANAPPTPAALVALACRNDGSENVPLTRWPVGVGGRVGHAERAVTGRRDDVGRRRGRVVLRDARDERAERGRRAQRQRERGAAPCRRRRR